MKANKILVVSEQVSQKYFKYSYCLHKECFLLSTDAIKDTFSKAKEKQPVCKDFADNQWTSTKLVKDR